MKGKIIIYRLGKELTRAERSRFYRELYGYDDKSNYGRYRYERKGLLSGVPHLVPARSVIVLRKKDSGGVVDFLRRHGASVYALDIVLSDEDLRTLGEK